MKVTVNNKMFMALCQTCSMPPPELEYVFHPTRKWRFDYAFPRYKIALECDGGVFVNGGHTRGKGYIMDSEKRNAAAMLGWIILRVVPRDLLKVDTINMIKACINKQKEQCPVHELGLAVEFGYTQCEKGNNIQYALSEFNKARNS